MASTDIVPLPVGEGEGEARPQQRLKERKDSGAIMLPPLSSLKIDANGDYEKEDVCDTPEEPKAKKRRERVLPAEIIDLIIDFVSLCPSHSWARRSNPCCNWHTPTTLRPLLQLRLVNRAFAHRITPVAFHHLVFHAGQNRHLRLSKISRSSTLCNHLRILRLEIAPKDLGRGMRRVNSMPLLSPEKKLHKFFEVLQIYLVPVLRRFSSSTTSPFPGARGAGTGRRGSATGGGLHTLHLTAKYDGLAQPSAPVKLHLLPKTDLFLPCFAALCASVRAADLDSLDTLVLGVPYEGGHTSYFEELQGDEFKNLLKGAAKNLRRGSLCVFDHQGGFTTVPFF